MSTLDKLRDELAAAFTWKRGVKESDGVEFKAGFNAAIKALSEGVEFDREAALVEYRKTLSVLSLQREEWIKAAHWQFEQDAARIGHAYEMRDNAFKACLATNDKLSAAEAENARLRGALERITTEPLMMPFDPKTHAHGEWSWLEIAREALSNGG